MQCNADTNGIISDNSNPMFIDNSNTKTDYFLPYQNKELDTRARITHQLQKEFKDMFRGIGCFDGTLPLQVKTDGT